MQERDARKGKKKAPKKGEKGFTKRGEACRIHPRCSQKREKRGLQRGVKRAEYIPGARESARAEEAAEGRG